MSLMIQEIPAIVCLSGNQMWVNYSTNQSAQDFIGTHYVVQRYIGSSWVTQGKEMRFEPDSNGEAPIDIRSLLEWDPEKEFTWSESASNLIHKRENLCRTYRVLVYEKYGNPLAQTDSETMSTRYILPGKISELRYGNLNDYSSSWWDSAVTRNKFLTNAPRIKKTDISAFERLFFIVHESADISINLLVKIYYTDGSDQTITKETETSVTNYTVYEIITSLDTLQLPYTDVTGPIEKYEVWLTNQSDVIISEIFTYLVDQTTYDEAKYFLFANAFKMIEGARFVNHLKTYTKSGQTELRRNLPKDFGVKDPSMIKDDISEVVFCDVSSDWLSPAEIRWHRELILSKEVYEIVGGQPVPIRVGASSVVAHEKDKYLRQINMTYSYGHADSVPADYSDFL